jgi:hypothetical protein
VPSQHRLQPRSFRPEPDEYAAAQAELVARERQMDAFLRACLRALRRDPDRFLAVLAPVWPSPNPTGRPPRQEVGAPRAVGGRRRGAGTGVAGDQDSAGT